MTGVIGEYYLDLEEDKELGLSVGCWEFQNKLYTQRRRILYSLRNLAQSIWLCKLDQIIADPRVNWYRLEWKKIDQKIVNGTVLN